MTFYQKWEKKLQTFDLSCLLGKNVFGDDGFQNIFVYQPTFNMLELKEYKGTEYIISWESKGLFKSSLKPLFNPLPPSLKQFGYKVWIQFLDGFLIVENNNYLIKIVNVYIVYDLNHWPRNQLNILR